MPILTQDELDRRREENAAAALAELAKLDEPISLKEASESIAAIINAYGDMASPVEAKEAGPGEERDEVIVSLRRNGHGYSVGRAQRFRITLAPIV